MCSYYPGSKIVSARAKRAKLLACVHYLIKQRAKLLNAHWSMKRAFFYNFSCQEGKITRSRLVLRLPRNSLCYREAASKKSVRIEELKDKSEIENTKKSTEYKKNVFKK